MENRIDTRPWLLLSLLNALLGFGLLAQPSNDNVCDAIAVSMNSPTTFSNIDATTQPGEVSPGVGSRNETCRSQDGWCFFEPAVQNSVWFSFIAPSSGQALISVFSDEADLQLALWQVGSCSNFGSFVELGANDDGNTASPSPKDPAIFRCDQRLVPGQRYYIQVDGFNGEETDEAEILIRPYESPVVEVTIEDCTEGIATASLTDGGIGDVSYDANGSVLDQGNGTITISDITADSVLIVTFDDVSSFVSDVSPCETYTKAGMDIEPPRFTDCPDSEVVLTTDEDDCEAVLEFSLPTAIDDICNIPIPTPTDVVLTIELDFLPNETSWELRNSAGQLMSAYAYSGNEFGTQIHTVSLRSDEYTFTIFDLAGDGICCGLGNGDWTINYTDDNGEQILSSPSGGQFGDSESVTFNVSITEPLSPSTVFQTQGPPSGTRLMPGTTTLAFEAIDYAGLSNSCTYTVRVVDISLPELECPANTTILYSDETDPNTTGDPIASDNCTVDELVFSDFSTQLAAGCGYYNYEITRTFIATDESGNTNTCEQLITVQGPPPPVLENYTLTLDNPSDCGLADGSIVIEGLIGYEYEISSDLGNWTTTPSFTQLEPGNYTISVRHPGIDCPDSYSTLVDLILVAPEPPNLDGLVLSLVDPSDCGVTDGAITLDGLSNYEYDLNGSNNWTNSPAFFGLDGGRYNIRVRNIDGTCVTVFEELNDLVLTNPVPPSLVGMLIELEDPSDCDLSDGSITIAGLVGYEYELNGSGAWTDTPVFAGLAEGRYHILVRNDNGTCETEFAVLNNLELTGPTPPNVDGINTEIASPSDCNNSDGYIILSGLDGSYEYSLNNSANWTNTPEFFGLSGGLYNFRIRNANGTCETEIAELGDLELATPEPPVFDDLVVDVSNPTDCGVMDGSIVLNGLAEYEYLLSGDITWTSTPVFTGLSAGLYTITVRGVNGICEANTPELIDIVLTAPSPPSLLGMTTTITSPSDCGGTDGMIVLDSPNGYEYELNGSGQWVDTPQFTGLVAGLYTIRIRNIGGSCERTFVELTDLEIVSPVPPSLDGLILNTSNTTDCDSLDGGIYLEGLPSYEYELNQSGDWTSVPSFINLGAGAYSIRIRNTDGSCATAFMALTDLEISAPTPPTTNGLIVELVDPSDCDGTDGSIILQGLTSYEYEINQNGQWLTTPIFNDLSAGGYTIAVRNVDSSCVTVFEELTDLALVAPLPPSLDENVNISTIDPSDCEGSDGAIVLAGIAGYEFELNNSGQWQSNPLFNGLIAGMYTIRLRNLDGSCETAFPALTNLELVEPQAPVLDNLTTSLIHPSDCGSSDGIIALNGPAVYEYELNGNGQWRTNPMFTGLAAGRYTIRTRNPDGSCVTTYSELTNLELNEPEPPTLDGIAIDITHPSDCNSIDGSIVLRGLSGYEYELDGNGIWTSVPEFSQLSVGSYSIRVRNLNGSCETAFIALSELLLVAPNRPDLTGLNIVLANPSDCNTTDGSITLQGLADYEYELNANGQWTRISVFTGLAPGLYTIRLRNIDGACESEFETLTDIELVTPNAPSISGLSVISTNPSNCDLADGSIMLQGLPNYEYELNSSGQWSNTPNFANLDGGLYTIRVRNIDGSCETTFTELTNIQLIAPSPPSLDDIEVILLNPTDCSISDGQIEFISSSNYIYELNNNGNWITDGQFTGLAGDIYSVAIRNPDGSCETLFDELTELELIAPQPPVIDGVNVIVIDPSDCGLLDGSITLTGLTGYEYELNGSETWSTVSEFNNLSPGQYTIRVRNIGGSCETDFSEFSNLTITALQPPAVSALNLTSQLPSDCDQNDGSVSISGPNAENYNYSLNGGAWQQQTDFINLTSGTYEVRASLPGGQCSTLVESVDITLPDAPVIVDVEVDVPLQCTDEVLQLGALTINATGNGSSLRYNFNYPAGDWQEDPSMENLGYGTYTIAVRNENGTCEVIGDTVHFAEEGPFRITTTSTESPSECFAADGAISLTTEGGSDSLQFSLDNGLTWQMGTAFMDLSAGVYTVWANDLNSTCLDSTIVNITGSIDTSQFTLTSVAVSTCGLADGGIVITNSTGNTYEYSIDNGTTWLLGPILSALPPGDYQVLTRTLAGNCTSLLAETITVAAPPVPVIDDVIITPPTECEGIHNTITILSVGASTSFEYSLDDGMSWQTSPHFEDVVVGGYQALIRNRVSLCKSEALAVDVNPLAELEIQTENVVTPACIDDVDGAIALITTGGVEPYSYNWSNGSTQQQLTSLAGGQTYSCTVVDARGCTATIAIELTAATTLEDLGVALRDTSACQGSSFRLGVDVPEVADLYWEDEQGNTYEGANILVEDAQQVVLNILTLDGCLLLDSVMLTYDSTERAAYFLLPDEGVINAPVVAIDISNPVPDDINWHHDLPGVVGKPLTYNQYELSFAEAGEYIIGMSANLGSCWTYLEKPIQIFNSREELSQELPEQIALLIQSLGLFPNPNTGTFQVNLQLKELQAATCWIFSESGTQMYFDELSPATSHQLSFQQLEWAPGLYTIVVQVGAEYRHANFIIL